MNIQDLYNILIGLPRDTEIRIVHKKGGTLPIIDAKAGNGYVTFIADHKADRHEIEVVDDD